MKKYIVGFAAASTLYVGLAGCGGGGSVHSNVASPPPTSPAYDPTFNQLIPTGVQAAQQAGFTGKDIKVGILGFGVDPTTPPLQGRITWFKSYLPGGSQSPNDTTGHGTVVADILGGLPQGVIPDDNGETFPGGVAQNASLYVEQVCEATGNPPCTWNVNNFNDFVTEQVRIINISLGEGNVLTEFTGPNDPNIPLVQAIYQPSVDTGIIFVWVAGNDGHTQPWQDAGLPYWIPSFQPNWLAVVNIAVDSNGKPAGLYNGANEPSNACGAAAQWCIGAPGVVFTPTPNMPGTAFTGGGVGTSFAAPIISGVAAQVLQAFPWMTAANVTDTILTTATQLDDGSHTTPNATFGWGMINAAKAINGPAQFAFPQFGPFTADIPSGVTSTFGNNIAGAGGLKLTGPGTLVLTGANTYQGGSQIAAGKLSVNGSVASNVSIDAGGILDGVGSINATVSNGGTLQSAGGKVGQGLTITGNLTETFGSTTMVQLSDPLKVNGGAAVDGTMLVLGAPSGYTVKSTETLINAGSVSGNYQNLLFGAGVFYTGALAYTPTQVNVNLQQAQAASVARALPGATQQTINAAAHLQGALDISNGWQQSGEANAHSAWMQAGGEFLSAESVGAAVVSLNSLSGEIYATTRRIEAGQSGLDDRALSNRLDDLARGASRGIWVQATGASGKLSQSGYSDADYDLGGAMAGLDVASDTGAVGVALGRSHLDADLSALGGHVDGRNDSVALYGRWNFDNGVYLSGRVAHDTLKIDVRRDVLLGTSLQVLVGAHDNYVDRATFEIGDTFGHFTQYANVTGLRLHQSAFAEQGAGGMGLTANKDTHDAALAELGLRWSNGWQWSGGHSMLVLRVAWNRILSGADLGFTGAFAGVPNSTFDVEGQSLPRNVIGGGVGLITRVGQHWSWYVDAGLETSRHSIQAKSLDAGLKWYF
jgi:outer membrane autotransporter protein